MSTLFVRLHTFLLLEYSLACPTMIQLAVLLKRRRFMMCPSVLLYRETEDDKRGDNTGSVGARYHHSHRHYDLRPLLEVSLSGFPDLSSL